MFTSDDGFIVKSISAGVHGHYLIDAGSSGASGLLVGFHGYGENAERHLQELRRIPAAGWRLASVQALHPFYIQKTGEVVASWMTKLDRERAIDDNLDYVRTVVLDIEREYGPAGRLVYLGFSQGAAMAYRAAAGGGRASGVIALAGDIPPELRNGSTRFPAVLVARGQDDTWYTDDVMSRDVEFLNSRRVPVETLTFDGGHEWTDAFRKAAGRFLQHVSAGPRG